MIGGVVLSFDVTQINPGHLKFAIAFFVLLVNKTQTGSNLRDGNLLSSKDGIFVFFIIHHCISGKRWNGVIHLHLCKRQLFRFFVVVIVYFTGPCCSVNNVNVNHQLGK